MKPKVNQELCIGCGQCEAICPEVFRLDDGKSHVLEITDYAVFKDKIEQAVDACPVQAISIIEE